MKGTLYHPFVVEMLHKSTNHFEKCIKCFSLYSSIVSSSVPQSGAMRLPLLGIPRGAENGFGSQRLFFVSPSTSGLYSNTKCHPSKQIIGHSGTRTYFSTFFSAERIYPHRKSSSHSCDFVRSIGNQTSENTMNEETSHFHHHSDRTSNVLDTKLQDPQRDSSQELEIVKKQSESSVEIDHDYEAETDFVYGGRREEKDVEAVSYDISQRLTYEDGKEPPLPSEIRAANIKALSHLISSAETCFDVFLIFEQHQKQLKFLHYELIAKKLSNVISRSSLEEVRCHPVFLKLCERLCKICCQYDPPMLMSLLQMLNSLKTPPNSLIMLTTLQMLRKKFDSLDVKELLHLDVLLSNSPQSALGNALKNAVPLALECLYGNLDLPSGLTPGHLSQGLFACAKSDNHKALAVAEKFMMMLYEHEQGVQNLTAPKAVTLVSGLLEVFQRWRTTPGRQQAVMGREEEEEEEEADQLVLNQSYKTSKKMFVEQLAAAREVLLTEVLQFMAQIFPQFTSCQVEELQKMLSYAFRNEDRCAHSQNLLDAFVRRMLEEGGSLQSLAGGVSWMLKMNAVDEALLQTMLEKLSLTSSEELCCTELHVMPLVHALASSNALQDWPKEQCHELLDKLLQHPSAQLQSQSDGAVSHVRLALDLASLGHFPPALHGTVMDGAAADALKGLDGSSPGSSVHQFMTLWQAHQLLDPQSGSLQVDGKLLSASKQFLLKDCHLSSSGAAQRAFVRQVLQHVLSAHGPDSVVTGVHTQHGALIDHVAVVRGSGEVVPQSAAASCPGSVCLDQLTVPDGSKVFGVVAIGPNMLLNNYTTMRPLARLRLQLLAAEGVNVVPFIMPQFILQCRTGEEKVDYISEAFRKHNLSL